MAAAHLNAASHRRIDDGAVESFRATYGDPNLGPVVVVIAAYDEEGSVAAVVNAIPGAVCGLATDVVVVADGCRDATAARAHTTRAYVVDVAVNRGQGAALRLGYRVARQAGGHVIVTIDADGQYRADEIETVARPVVDGRADFVSGSRRLGRDEGADRVRRAGVGVFAAVVTRIVGSPVTDPANGLRAMRADVTAVVPLHQDQYQAAELLIGAALAGYRIAEVPTTMSPRIAGTTKKGPNLRYGARFSRVIVRTTLRSSFARLSFRLRP